MDSVNGKGNPPFFLNPTKTGSTSTGITNTVGANTIDINNDTNNNAALKTGSFKDGPEFYQVLKTFLDSMSKPDSGNSENDSHADFESQLLSLLNQNAMDTKLPWDKLIQAGIFTQDQNRLTNTAPDPLTALANAQVIAKYKIAMENFRQAMQTSPEKMANIDKNTLNQIANGVPLPVPGLDLEAKPAENPLGLNPTKQQVADYVVEQCREIGVPEQLGLATAFTESEMTQFNKDGTVYHGSNPDSTDWGIMQINDKAWGDRFDMNRLRTDWQYNVRAGLQILKNSYDTAIKNSEADKGPGPANQNLARAAYSGYNAGEASQWRYRTPVQEAPKRGSYDVLNHEGYDLRDIRFWDNYLRFS
ncbi:MAG TPA: hypothetical protein DDW65_08120 [Firmicutes bacterium]|jgi:hypothetical protein|nr:hypothetical protein [Bacillota bacterium]